MKSGTPSKRVVLVGLSSVLLIVVAALLVFYGLSIWPKQSSTDTGDKTEGITSTGNVKTVTPTPVKVEVAKNSKDNNKEVKMLRTYVVIQTKEQGDCFLTLSNDKNTYVVKNSSVGVEHAVGCLQWNVSTDGMAAGEYDLTVEFKGKSDHAVVKQKLNL